MKRFLLLTITFLISTNSFAHSVNVFGLKSKLKELGYYTGAVNDDFDNAIHKAMNQFMSDRKACPKDIDHETCKLLNDFQREFK